MRILVIAACLWFGGIIGTANAETIKPSHGNVKTLMCYQYSPGSWITVYIPSQQVDKWIAKGDYLFGECLPA